MNERKVYSHMDTGLTKWSLVHIFFVFCRQGFDSLLASMLLGLQGANMFGKVYCFRVICWLADDCSLHSNCRGQGTRASILLPTIRRRSFWVTFKSVASHGFNHQYWATVFVWWPRLPIHMHSRAVFWHWAWTRARFSLRA